MQVKFNYAKAVFEAWKFYSSYWAIKVFAVALAMAFIIGYLKFDYSTWF